MPIKLGLCVVLLCLSGRLFANPDMVMCIENQDYKPYFYSSESNKNVLKGIMVDAVTESAHKLGVSLKLVRHPWLRCQSLVKQGQIHGLLGMVKNKQRAKQFSFPPEQYYLLAVDYAIIVKKDGMFDQNNASSALLFDRNNLLDITAYRAKKNTGLDAPFGHLNYHWLKEQNLLTPIHTDIEVGLRLIQNERLDGYVIERVVAQEWLQSSGLSNELKVTNGVLLKTHLYGVFNQRYFAKNGARVSEFWRVMHQQGTSKVANYLNSRQ